MNISTALIAACTVLSAVGAAQAVPAAAPPKVVQACQQCHGAGGNSTNPNVPRLNGQQRGYLEARLKALRDPTRQTPPAIHAMWDLANHIADDDIPVIAAYFASQSPTPANGHGALADQGRKLYERGASEDIPACQSCHGANGEGQGNVPRLAGQHQDYLAMQILDFRLTMRPHPLMSVKTRFVNDEQIKALAAYLAGH